MTDVGMAVDQKIRVFLSSLSVASQKCGSFKADCSLLNLQLMWSHFGKNIFQVKNISVKIKINSYIHPT